MYREMLAEDHRRVIGLSEDEIPHVLLLLGSFNVHTGAERFASYLGDVQPLKKGIPGYVGRFEDLRVGLVAAFGGPMAAFHAHTWAAAGVPCIAQLGWYGALQPGTELADVVVPRHAERQDGVSDWYLPKGILADASPELAEATVAELEARGVRVDQHAIYSTPALLAESREVIADWSRHGWFGVDMETAATFSVAKSIGVQRVAALIRFDDLITEEDHLTARLPRERIEALRAREPVVVEAVLRAVSETRSRA